MDRRSFLKSLFATAIATQLPDVSVALRDKVAERAANAVRVHEIPGQVIQFQGLSYTSPSGKFMQEADGLVKYMTVKVEHVSRVDSDIWEVRVTSAGRHEGGGVSVSLDTGDPQGVFLGDEDHLRAYLSEHPERIGVASISVGGTTDMTFWMVVK